MRNLLLSILVGLTLISCSQRNHLINNERLISISAIDDYNNNRNVQVLIGNELTNELNLSDNKLKLIIDEAVKLSINNVKYKSSLKLNGSASLIYTTWTRPKTNYDNSVIRNESKPINVIQFSIIGLFKTPDNDYNNITFNIIFDLNGKYLDSNLI